MMFVGTCNLYSQDLYVDDNSYLYARDVVIFVNDDIRLETATSNIYMRGDAQLMQNTNTKNSDLGELSIYQNQTTGIYEYNFWCSPVGVSNTSFNTNVDFDGTNIHDPDDEVDLTNVTSTPYGFINNSYDGTATQLASYWIFTFISGGGYADWNLELNTGNISTGYGFTLKGSPNINNTLDFRGRPNNGDIAVDCFFSGIDSDPNSGSSNQVETLTGNPYPSALDLKEFIKANTSVADGGSGDPLVSYINGEIYFWEQQTVGSHNLRDYQGGYGVYTAGDLSDDTDNGNYVRATFSTYDDLGGSNGLNLGNGVDYGPNNQRRFAAVGQGFMISSKINPGDAPSPPGNQAFFTNAMRVYFPEDPANINGSVFAKNNSDKTKIVENIIIPQSHNSIDYKSIVCNPTIVPEIRIHTKINNTFYRENLIAFRQGTPDNSLYNNNFDGKYGDFILGSDAYILSENIPLVIKSIRYDQSVKIPIGLRANRDNTSFDIKIHNLINVPENITIYLHNKLNDTYTDIKNNAFSIILDEGIYNEEFEITFSKENTLHINANDISNFKIFENTKKSHLEIINPKRYDIQQITIYDISGKEILKQNTPSSKRKTTISTRQLSSGVYLITLKLSDSQVLNKKIMISGNLNF
ncbi:T9SS type A sorting domain-containing protein [Hyunsoonleella sp. 2307UL5-6]|uniref:T9SS type A sorting domain-containing protein n=1 Tax=Hyunsoonleella sp. 2307UL5-6 TaxID=3384768 RepID=UPI0039BD310D